jgi:membrane protein implicated in regulation of membrane protease activity
MREALWGLAASGVLYTVGSVLLVQLVRRWWAEQPDDLHPELRRDRDQARAWKLRSLFRPPERRSLIWLGGAALIFAVLWATEFGLLFQVLYVAALSLWWTIEWIDAQRSENRELRQRLGVEAAPAGGLRHCVYVGGIYVLGFMISAGTLGAACFLGAAIAEGLS